MTIKLQDIDKAQAWAVGGILPPGWHNVKVVAVEEGVSSGGHPQIELDLESLTGDGKIKDWIVVMESTLGKIRQLIDAAGVQLKGGEWDFDPAVLQGSEVSILVREKPKYGEPDKTVNEVVGYEMPRGAPLGGAGNGASNSDADIPFGPSLV